jgi:hypothetical protein
MEKILKARFNLGGKEVCLIRSDGSHWLLSEYDGFHGWYMGTNTDTGEPEPLTERFTPSDLIGNYIV